MTQYIKITLAYHYFTSEIYSEISKPSQCIQTGAYNKCENIVSAFVTPLQQARWYIRFGLSACFSTRPSVGLSVGNP